MRTPLEKTLGKIAAEELRGYLNFPKSLLTNPNAVNPKGRLLRRIHPSRMPSRNGFVYVPSINLYVSTSITLKGRTYEEIDKETSKSDYQILTIPEMKEFIEYLRLNPLNGLSKYLLDSLFTTDYTGGFEGEFLDTRLRLDNKNIRIRNRNKISHRNRVGTTIERILSPHIVEVSSIDSFGIPTQKTRRYLEGETVYYSPPNSKLHFTNSVWSREFEKANLDCSIERDYSDSSVGVRLAKSP
jgi:hypothetical protein